MKTFFAAYLAVCLMVIMVFVWMISMGAIGEYITQHTHKQIDTGGLPDGYKYYCIDGKRYLGTDSLSTTSSVLTWTGDSCAVKEQIEKGVE